MEAIVEGYALIQAAGSSRIGFENCLIRELFSRLARESLVSWEPYTGAVKIEKPVRLAQQPRASEPIAGQSEPAPHHVPYQRYQPVARAVGFSTQKEKYTKARERVGLVQRSSGGSEELRNATP